VTLFGATVPPYLISFVDDCKRITVDEIIWQKMYRVLGWLDDMRPARGNSTVAKVAADLRPSTGGSTVCMSLVAGSG